MSVTTSGIPTTSLTSVPSASLTDSLTNAISSVISSNISSVVSSALSNTNSIASAAATAISTMKSVTNANKHALLIGCNYTSIPNITLKGCINDVINIEHMLIDAYGYYQENIVVLRDDSANPALKPTNANIMTQIQNLVAKSGSYSQIWIHYSGHGIQLPDMEQDSISDNGTNTKLEGCIVPLDYQSAGVITRDVLYDHIKNIKCPAIMMWDACHSGTLCDLEWSFICQSASAYSRIQTNNVSNGNLDIYSISGCRDSQVSYDSYNVESQIPMGAFTCAVIACLRQAHHNIPIMLLYRNICAYLANAGINQLPILSSFNPAPSLVICQ